MTLSTSPSVPSSSAGRFTTTCSPIYQRFRERKLADGTFRDIWGHGSALLKRIYNLPMVERRNRLKLDLLNNLRNFKEDERSYGKRPFLQSKNLIVPPTIKGDFDELMERLKAKGYVPKLMDSYSFETEFLGTIQLGTYWLTK